MYLSKNLITCNFPILTSLITFSNLAAGGQPSSLPEIRIERYLSETGNNEVQEEEPQTEQKNKAINQLTLTSDNLALYEVSLHVITGK